MSPLMIVMEDLLNDKEQLRQKQIQMMEYATALPFGLGSDAHEYDDAFSQILLQLKKYVFKLNSG